MKLGSSVSVLLSLLNVCVSLTIRAQTRAGFLSSSAAALLTSSFVRGQEQCDASTWISLAETNKNPRYIEKELQMKYGEGPDGNPRTRGILVRRLTGDSTPYSFPVQEVSLVKEWPEKPPFKPEDFFRSDSNDDKVFYTVSCPLLTPSHIIASNCYTRFRNCFITLMNQLWRHSHNTIVAILNQAQISWTFVPRGYRTIHWSFRMSWERSVQPE